MSLQVWLPLTKDLRQQGLSNTTVSIMRGNETWNNNGKLGKCFYANGVNTLQINNIIPQLYNASGYSLCAWFYIESQNTVHSGSGIVSGGNWNSQVLNLSLSNWSSDHYTRLRVSGTNWNNTYSYNFYKNTWYHAVVCSDGNKTYAYINGQLIGDTVAGFLPSSIEGNNIAIGGATYYSGMQFFGKINDVRIYDHCLSPMEVKELAKGLVLHYPLNRQGWGQENLLLNTFDLTKWTKESTCTITLEEDGYYHIVSTNTSGARYGIYYDFTFPEVGTYTLSADVKTDWRIGFSASSTFGWTANNITGTGNARKVTKTITTTSENNKCRIYINSSMNSSGVVVTSTYIKNIKVEKGEIATPWCPNPSDTLYTTMGINGTTEYDCSGFCNNLTRHGIYSYVSDTPKYSVSTKFSGTEWMNGTTPGADILTLSCWAKTTKSKSTSQFMVADSTSKLCISFYSGTIISYFSSSGTGTGSKCTLGSAYKENDWNHFVVVKTGDGTRTVYCNGVEQTPTSNDWWSGATGFFIGSRNTSGTLPFYGQLCDVRAYATALSAEDILDLYKQGHHE